MVFVGHFNNTILSQVNQCSAIKKNKDELCIEAVYFEKIEDTYLIFFIQEMMVKGIK